MIKKIAEYHIHNETGKFNHLKEKSGNFTLKADEQVFEQYEFLWYGAMVIIFILVYVVF